MRTDPVFLVVDLFCGAGGTTTGFELADGYAKVIACVNHDPKAIKSHWLNHPDVKHFEEDIRTLDLAGLIEGVNYWKTQYPDAALILWASLECTNFSKAKGGKPRDADSRTLADHLDRYILALNPDYVQIENVVEFRSWGPLDDNGKPINSKAGEDWMRWRNRICSYGYEDDWKELNSANFGAYTSRNRLFGIFASPDLPISWPLPTHAKNPSKLSIEGDLRKWKPVKDVLNFSDEGNSIFNRKKPLSDKTLQRIYAGLIKYVANGDKAFISKYYSGRPAGKAGNADGARTALVSPQFLTIYNGKSLHRSVDEPSPVIPTNDRFSLVQPQYLVNYNHSSTTNDINEPAPTLVTRDKIALLQPKYFIDKHYGTSQNQSIDQPAGTILPTDKHRLVEAVPFIMPTNYNNTPKSIEDPLQTITANRKHHYLVNPCWKQQVHSIDHPSPVIIARQDKTPLYLVQVETGQVAAPIYEDDSEIMIKIKEFMVIYQLIDIKMRMLRVNELLTIQGFPQGYQLEGNQADQKKFIGNSVVPDVVKAWTIALARKVTEDLEVKVA
jgi:DNA (cytosine-5)-methyltransferase 1